MTATAPESGRTQGDGALTARLRSIVGWCYGGAAVPLICRRVCWAQKLPSTGCGGDVGAGDCSGHDVRPC